MTHLQFEKEFDRLNPKMLSLMVLRGINRDTAEDIAQQTWSKVWASLASWRQECSFSTWVYHVMFNEIAQFKRGWHQTKIEYVDLDQFVHHVHTEKTVGAKIRLDRVLRDIDLLPEEMREAVRMRIMGFTNAEIAKATGVQIETAKTRVYRGIKALKGEK